MDDPTIFTICICAVSLGYVGIAYLNVRAAEKKRKREKRAVRHDDKHGPEI